MQNIPRLLIVPILMAASVVFSVRASAALTICSADKRKSLVRGHFSGPLVCSHRNASFRFVGKTARTGLSIYDYRYRFLPSGGQVMHGGQRVLVFHGEEYAGQYALATPPFNRVTVTKSHGVLDTPGAARPVDLDFSRRPPARILVNGEIASFFR